MSGVTQRPTQWLRLPAGIVCFLTSMLSLAFPVLTHMAPESKVAVYFLICKKRSVLHERISKLDFLLL